MKQGVLLVDDDPGTIRLLGRILVNLGEVRFATSGEAALRLARESAPDVILLDAQMPGMCGFEVCRALKADPLLADVPVIIVTSNREPAFEVAGFAIGAADFIVKPVNASLVLARVQTQLRHKRMADELRRIATIDVLTGVSNRRRFDESIAREWRRARRSSEPLALLMIDVDHFKAFNDCYGHPAGDACLRSIAQALVAVGPRAADLVARYGGEEFVVLLPQTPRAGAEHVARAVLVAVAKLAIAHEVSPVASHVTVSVGIGCLDEKSACWSHTGSGLPLLDDLAARCTPLDLVRAADQALYVAKRAGRGRGTLVDIADVEQLQTIDDPVRSDCRSQPIAGVGR